MLIPPLTVITLFLEGESSTISPSTTFTRFYFISDFGESCSLVRNVFCLYPCLVKNFPFLCVFILIKLRPLSKAEIPPSDVSVPVWFVQLLFIECRLIGDAYTQYFLTCTSRCFQITPCNTLVCKTPFMKSNSSPLMSDLSAQLYPLLFEAYLLYF